MKRTEIERLLPDVFRRTAREGSPLFALLAVMEALHAPSEAALERLDTTFDPRRAADDFVPFLARWVDLERLYDALPGGGLPATSERHPIRADLGHVRELVATAASLSKWRGPAKGLLLFLQTATGVAGFEVDERVAGPDGRPRPYHIRVRAPESAAVYRFLIERVVEIEKPAHVTYEIEFSTEVGGLR